MTARWIFYQSGKIYIYSHLHMYLAGGIMTLIFLHLSDLSRFWLSCLGPLVVLLPSTFKIIWLFSLSILSVPDEGYCRNMLCALNLIISTWKLSHTRQFFTRFQSRPYSNPGLKNIVFERKEIWYDIYSSCNYFELDLLFGEFWAGDVVSDLVGDF